MRMIWTPEDGWRCEKAGPHGPDNCGPVPEDDQSCACGCTDFYDCCPARSEWWDTFQSLISEPRK